jgi:hypothetical protein
MANTTIIGIALFAVAAVPLFVILGVVLRQRRTAHRHVQARDIRDRAAEQSHTVSEREAVAEETAAQARVAQAEGDANTAHVKKEFERVKKEFERPTRSIRTPKPTTHQQKTPERQTPPATPGDTHGPRPMRRAG